MLQPLEPVLLLTAQNGEICVPEIVALAIGSVGAAMLTAIGKLYLANQAKDERYLNHVLEELDELKQERAS